MPDLRCSRCHQPPREYLRGDVCDVCLRAEYDRLVKVDDYLAWAEAKPIANFGKWTGWRYRNVIVMTLELPPRCSVWQARVYCPTNDWMVSYDLFFPFQSAEKNKENRRNKQYMLGTVMPALWEDYGENIRAAIDRRLQEVGDE